MGVVMKAQEGGAWRQGGPALALLQKLLALAIDNRPKIRQAAQNALAATYSRPSPLPATATSAAHNFCVDVRSSHPRRGALPPCACSTHVRVHVI
jgi:hypothetical protein